ncbi:MAG: hypothetical protein P9M15_04535 [Candidatus Electryoneaceae bacterium]|nr:hypothetical protein [Candidatus Electryoneaceae bacterium]
MPYLIGGIIIFIIVLYIIIYIIIPLLAVFAAVGILIGGGQALYNYSVSFKKNVMAIR